MLDADVAATPALIIFFSPVITPIKLLPEGSLLTLPFTAGARSAEFVSDVTDADIVDVATFGVNVGFLNPNFQAVVLSSPFRLLEEVEVEVENEEEEED